MSQCQPMSRLYSATHTVAEHLYFSYLLRLDGRQFDDDSVLVYINFYTRWWINCIYSLCGVDILNYSWLLTCEM